MLLADEQVSSVSSAGNVLWPLADHLGTIRDIADYDEGDLDFEITNHRVYDSFGRLESETNSAVDLAFGYTGKYTDDATGHTHHLNRWYDPTTGRWLSEDPIGFAAGDTNLSRYVGNEPVGHVDSLGLFEQGMGYTGPESDSPAAQDDEKPIVFPNEPTLGQIIDSLGFSEPAQWSVDSGVKEIAGHQFPYERWTDTTSGKEWFVLKLQNGSGGYIFFPSDEALNDSIKEWWMGQCMLAAARHTITASEFGLLGELGIRPMTGLSGIGRAGRGLRLSSSVHSALDEIKSLGSLAGKSKGEIEAMHRLRGYRSTPANNGGTVWTKPLPDGNTAAVRIDPPVIKSKPKGFADEVPHVHKEVVPTNKVQSGNYGPGDATRLDDYGIPSADPRKTHIPGGGGGGP
ncbi:MAG TPA: RHS repeat-associated core domain-containing protein [Pirellulaceae bacterium]|nr:RHS repeat-associated core domain-containing protein [Pirellulaceae bacterium]